MTRNYFLFAVIFSFSFLSCKKKEILSSTKELLSFKFEAEKNPLFIKEDAIGILDGATYSITFPYGTELTDLIPTFTTNGISVKVNGIEQQSGVTSQDFSSKVRYVVTAADRSNITFTIVVLIKEKEKVSVVPKIFIDIQNGATVVSKDDYLNAEIRIEGLGGYDDFTGTTKIRGRGNTTWDMPKKPYRLKLDKAASLLGLGKGKNWILLANYLDYTLMLNAVGMKTAQLLEMPFTNNIVPVDLTINGKFAGHYMFTEHKEVGKNRIDIDKDDVLLELDSYFDEKFQFLSQNFRLPVMIAYPELEDFDPGEAQTRMAEIRSEFNTFENLVASGSFPSNDYLDHIDATSLVRYFIVYNLCQNEEINHPKSLYMYKNKGGKYKMGPVWDFDWAFDYEDHYRYFTTYNKNLFWNSNKALEGTKFFSRFLKDPAIQSIYRSEWNTFRNQKLPLLLQYIDDYSALIQASQKADYAVWKRGNGDFEEDVQKLRSWIQNRASYIDAFVENLN